MIVEDQDMIVEVQDDQDREVAAKILEEKVKNIDIIEEDLLDREVEVIEKEVEVEAMITIKKVEKITSLFF